MIVYFMDYLYNSPAWLMLLFLICSFKKKNDTALLAVANPAKSTTQPQPLLVVGFDL